MQGQRCRIDSAVSLAFFDALFAADKTNNQVGEFTLLEGKPKRAAQQTDANQCDFFPAHRQSFGVQGAAFKLERERLTISQPDVSDLSDWSDESFA